jgi:DNA-binding NarL/FixJ family response regulator
MNETVKKIIIADDHAVVRTGLQLILEETSDLRIVDEADNGDELIEKLHHQQFDIVILDINMPGKDATDVLLEIRNKYGELPVVVFSMNNDEAFALRMISNGASAYINKESSAKNIVEVLRKVATGQKYITPTQSTLMLDKLMNKKNINKLPHEELTDREFQVFCLLALGLRSSEIAQKLEISKNTVSNHRDNILKKMGFAGNSELTRYALQNGFIH